MSRLQFHCVQGDILFGTMHCERRLAGAVVQVWSLLLVSILVSALLSNLTDACFAGGNAGGQSRNN